MSKIMKAPPAQWKGPVRITNSKYAIWSNIPIKLGEINKSGNYWITPDGMRFISSRDAAEYMLKMFSVSDKGINVAEVLKSSTQALKEATKVQATVKTEPKVERRALGTDVAKSIVAASQVAPKVEAKAVETPKPSPVLQKDLTTGSPGRPNNAVTSRQVKLQKLIDSVRELQKELQGQGEVS